MIGSDALLVVVLSEEDAMSEEGKAGSSIHLSLQEFRFGVHSFGASVVVREGDRSGDGVDVLIDTSDEGVHVGKVRFARVGGPFRKRAGLSL
jgi:hypothetical protein